jgi:hypothetical protein
MKVLLKLLVGTVYEVHKVGKTNTFSVIKHVRKSVSLLYHHFNLFSLMNIAILDFQTYLTTLVEKYIWLFKKQQ